MTLGYHRLARLAALASVAVIGLRLWGLPCLACQGPALAQVAQLEQRLYGRVYPQQPLPQRLSRLERSVGLKGDTTQQPPSQRVCAVVQAQRQAPQQQRSMLRSLRYLEQRLGVWPSPDASVGERLSLLEERVFGPAPVAQPSPDTLSPVTLLCQPPLPMLSPAQRLERLNQALPLALRSLRLQPVAR
jgi:hypothetical protein